MQTLTGRQAVSLAREMAFCAHARQTDKAGEPYSEHLSRVAAGVSGCTRKVCAYLHDSLEDCVLSKDELLQAGFESVVVQVLELLTHKANERYLNYVLSLAFNDHARAVKLADIADNADMSRLSRLDEASAKRLMRKYDAAKTILENVDAFCKYADDNSKTRQTYKKLYPKTTCTIEKMPVNLRFVVYAYCAYYKISIECNQTISSLEKKYPLLVAAVTGALDTRRDTLLA